MLQWGIGRFLFDLTSMFVLFASIGASPTRARLRKLLARSRRCIAPGFFRAVIRLKVFFSP
jgi:hypothetical protein